MDFIFKLLFLGGKYISQAAGRTILEIYHRSIQFGKHVNVQYEKASEIIKPYDNMLELLNERVKEASEDDIHLACIGEELKKQLEEHLKRMPNVKYEEINELAAAKSCWKDKEPALALVEDENGLISKDLEYDKMYTDLYKDLSNVIVKNTSVNCPIDQIAVSLPTRNIAFKTSQTSEVQEFHDTTAFTQKLATSNKDEEPMLTEDLKDNNGELAETAFQPFHFEKHRKSCRCNPLPSLYSTDVSYMKYLIDHSPSDSYYKANAIGSYNGQAVDSLSCTKEQNRSSYTNLDEIIQINNKEIIKGLGEEIKNRMVLLKKNNEHFKTFEKRLHDRIIKSKVKQIAKDVELRSSILAQNTSHYNKFENRLEKKLKRTINKLITHRTLSSGNVDSSKRDLDESIKEIINLLKVNEKEFQKLEQKVTQRLIHEKLNSDNPFKANMKEKNASSRYLSDYDKADRKERTKILEINEKVFKKFEKDMCNIVILEKNKPMDKEDKLISERFAKYHVNVHNDSTFNEPLNMDRLKLNTQRDFSLNQLKTQTTKKNEKKTLKYRSSMADPMEDARERADIIEANAKAFEIFENKMNNLKPTKLPKSSSANDKDIKGSRVTKADDSEVDSIQIINTLKEVLDNSTIFKPPKLNSRVNSTDRNLHLEKIKKVLSTKKKADIIPRYISPVKKEINENPTTASIGVMHDEPQKLQQKCKAKNEKCPPKTSKGSEHSKQNIDETKNQKIEGNFRKHREKSDYKLKSDIKNEQEIETFLATMKRLQKVVTEYKNELSKNSLPASDNVTSHKSEDKQKKELPQHKQIKFKGETDCKLRDHPLSEKENSNLSGTPTANLKDYQRSRIPKFHSAQSELRREQTMSKSRKQDVEIDRKRAKSESSVKMFDEEQIRDISRKENQNSTNIKEAINQCRGEIDHANRKLSVKSSERRGKDNKVSSEDRESKLSKENISEIKENSFPEYEKQGDDNNMKVAISKRINNHYYVVYKTDRATPEGELNCKHEKMVEFTSKSDINRENVVSLNKAGFDKKVAESKDDKAINNKETYSTDKIAKDSDSKLPQFNTKVNHANDNETDVNMSKKDFNDEKRNPVEKVSTPKRTQSETRENDYRVMNASYNILRALKIVEDKLASEEKISKAASRNSETSTPKIRQQENRKSENFDLKKRIDRPEPFIEDLRLKHDNIHKMKSSYKAIYSKPLDVSQETDNCEVKTDMKVKSNNVDLQETNSRNQEGKGNATQCKESKVKVSPNHQDAPTKFFEYDTFRKFQTARKLKNIDIPKEEVLINKSKEGEEMIKPIQKISFQNHNKNTQSNQSDQTVNVVNNLKKPLRTLEEHKYSIPPTNPSISKIKEKAIIDNDAKPVNESRSNSPTTNHVNKKNELNQYNKNIFPKSSSKYNERVNKEFDKDIENCEKTGADGGKNSNDTLNVGKLKLRKILAYVPADMQAFQVLQNLYDINEKHKENMNMSESTKDRKVIQTNKMGEGINPKIITTSVEDRTESPEKVNMEPTANKIKQQKFSFKPFRQSSVDSKKKCDLNTRESELGQQDGNIELLRRHSAIPLRTEKQRLEVYNGNRNREDAPHKIEQNALPKNAQGKTVIKASNMKQECNKENDANHQEIKHLSSRRHENTDFNNKIRSEPQKGSSPPVEILTTGTTTVRKTNEVERQVQLSRKSFNNEIKEMRESPKNTLPQADDSMCKKEDLEPRIIYRRPFPKVNVKVEANPSTENVELQTKDESKSTTSNSPFKIAKFSFIPIKQKLQNDEKNEAIAKEKPFKDEINLQSTMSTVPTFTKESAGNTIKIQGTNVLQQNETVNDNLVCKKQKIQSLLGELRKELLVYSKISSEENKPPIRELTDAISKLNSEAKRKEMQYKITKENLQNKKVEAVDKADKDQNLCKKNQDTDQICKDIYQEDEEDTETTETTNILFREAKFSFIPMKNVQNYTDPDVSRKDEEKDQEEINIQPPPKQPDPFPQNLSPLLRYFLRKQLFKGKEAPKIDLGGDENAEENLSALETQDDFEISNAHLSRARSAESVYDRYPLVLKRKPTLQNTPKGALEWKMRFIQQSQLKGSTNKSEQHHNQSPLPNNRSQMQFTSRISTMKMQSIKNSTSRQLSTAIPIRKGLNPEISTYDIQSIRDIPVNNCKRNPIRIKKASSNMHESVKVMFFNK